jgi:hypothetical protein
MDLKAYLEKFESVAKDELTKFVDFIHAEERKLQAPFHSDVPVVPAPSADDGNPAPAVAQAPVEAPVEAPAEEVAPVAETAPEAPAEAPVAETPVEEAPAEAPAEAETPAQ